MTEWRDDAACRGVPINVFYPPEGKGPKPARQYASAERYCAACPVRRACQADAFLTDRLFGTHGYRAGMTPEARVMLYRRPKKAVT